MRKKPLSVILILCVILSFTACGTTDNIMPEMSNGTDNSAFSSEIATSAAGTEKPADRTTTDLSETPSSQSNTDSTTTASNKPTDPPVSNAPTQSTPKPPNVSTPSRPPSQSSEPSNTPSTPSIPPAPEYEILGQDYLKGVLDGINERRSALGLPLAKLNSTLSNECLVQAKKMAEAGHTFHSENPTGCEGVAKVPYNYPAELIGDVMCSHVSNFLDTDRINVGVAVVKKGNSLFAVVQGIY